MPETILRPVKLRWRKSTGGYYGSISDEYVISGFLYNLFPPIVSEDLLVSGGYITRLAYLVNEYDRPVAHVRIYFVYPEDEIYGDPRGRDETQREVLLFGRQYNREIPPSNAPSAENKLPSGIYMYKIPLDGSDFNTYDRGIEVGYLDASEAIPVWFALKIPPFVQPVIITFIRIIAEGVLVNA